ncbi:MAG: RDD family protein [Bacteroidota bacterium]
MPNKKLPFYLAVASIILAAWGLYTNVTLSAGINIPSFFRQALELVYLGLPVNSGMNYAMVVFHVSLLLGSVLYLGSSGREVRLFRACFGVIFFYNIIIAIYGTGYLLFGRPMPGSVTTVILLRIFYYLKEFLLISLSWRLLHYFDQYKTVAIEAHEYNGETVSFTVAAGLWQRLTHALLDAAVTIFVFAPIIEGMLYALSRSESVFFSSYLRDDRSVLWLIFILCRIVYYLIFEGLIGSTPAKMMTETRIIDSEGLQPGFPRILGRTFARLIPFDGLSFLFKAKWHDNLSGTHVVQDKRTGKPGAVYYLLPVILLVSIVGYNSIRRQIAVNKMMSAREDQHEQEQRILEDQIQHPVKTEFFLLDNLDASNSYRTGPPSAIYLKAEQDKGDSIRFTKLEAYGLKYTLPGQQEVEHQYTAARDTLLQITLAKADLKKAYLENGFSLQDGEKALNINGTNYGIKSIQNFFRPRVDLDGSGGYGVNYLSIGLKNSGWPADIISVDILEGGGTLKSILPIRLERTGFANGNASITISTGHPNDDIKLNLTARDTTGRQYRYQISGSDGRSGTLRIQELK